MRSETEKILITGANGFLGSHLADYCINNGYYVYALDLPERPMKNLIHYTKGQLKFKATGWTGFCWVIDPKN